MNKRIKKKWKKLHLGPYRCWVFSVRGTSPNVLEMPDELLTWADDLGLMIGGLVGGETLDFIVDRCSDPRCSCGKFYPFGVAESDRKLVSDWLTARGCVVETSALWDVHYGEDPFEEAA